MARVVIAGSTGFIGRALVAALVARGVHVTSIMRPGTESRLPAGAECLTSDPLNRATFLDAIRGFDAFVQLIGVPSPNPSMAEEFRRIDGSAGREGARACTEAGIPHYVYLSIPPDVPIMKSYVAVRAEVEALIASLGLTATVVRPFYVLGPGRRWPYFVMPLLWIGSVIPGLSRHVRTMAFNTREQVVDTIVHAIEHPPTGIDVWGVQRMKNGV